LVYERIDLVAVAGQDRDGIGVAVLEHQEPCGPLAVELNVDVEIRGAFAPVVFIDFEGDLFFAAPAL
jgi:hypothetical protein